ncbi:serine hydrolase domain-containing protein [Yinghuangia soli]|uniref:Beta-lactamase family protein n=1 Tax=Yinghuangia soli TaxID=2908204 RepID=A0AA41PV17_9ACTN|nr:serine hydrolase domain-containing protein [Yinghuangia soli]MCF2525726.1 beta-lactamase family protein [Yinghuangia soli]
MSTDGLSRSRLGRVRDAMAKHVEQGALPGAVGVVARGDDVWVEAVGSTAFDGGRPMARDTIFRIASMSKPVTAVVALMLVEEAVLRLDDPVDAFLPELADRRVLRSLDADPADPGNLIAAERPITLRDLLTFRLGYGALLAAPGTYPVQKALADAGLAPGPPKTTPPSGLDDWLARLGGLPLLHQPGASWLYHTGSTVLGALLVRATGTGLEELYQERLFRPLGMTDTAFHVPPHKRDRLATAYRLDRESGVLVPSDLADASSKWADPPAFPDAGADLVSTADDFLRFGRLLLDKGTCPGGRLLSRASVELMTRNHLTPAQQSGDHYLAGPPESRGWGFGVSVVTARDQLYATPGRYGWEGGMGTSWAGDPAEDVTGILLGQATFETPGSAALYEDFWNTAYAALDA